MASVMFLFLHLLLAYPSFGVQYVEPPQSSFEASGSVVPNALMRNQRSDLDDLGEVVGGWEGMGKDPDLPDDSGAKAEKASDAKKAIDKAAKDSHDKAQKKSDKAAEGDHDKAKDKSEEKSDEAEQDSEKLADPFHFESKKESCAPLKSHGTYYTVDLQVGTPGQTFSVVADTGSDAVIVPSCVCTEGGACNKKDRCFRGTNKSATFSIAGLNKTTGPKPKLPVINMFFGSGEIRAIVATDMVNVGGVKSYMKNSVMLMVDQALRIQGVFEGILGLGPPKGNHTDFRLLHKQEPAGEVQTRHGNHHGSPFKTHSVSPNGAIHSAIGAGGIQGVIQKILHDAMAKSAGNIEDAVGNIAHNNPSALQELSVDRDDYWPFGIPKPKKDDHFQPLGFDYASKVTGFSMCFNDMGKEGALHLGVPAKENSMLSVGYEHWGLDFQGISVGDSSEDAPVKFCTAGEKKEGMKTACGAIPDSGTTLFMAPMDHVQKLFGELCDKWDRCKTAVDQGLEKEKMTIFRMLLHECSSWVSKSGDKNSTLHEMPDMHFRLAGKDGKKQTISLTGDDYIIETMEDEVEMVTRNIFGMPMKIPHKTGKMKRVCAPAFSVMEMQTKENGHVWILGAPLFYKYTVSYDNDAKKPSIAFDKHKSCGCPSAKKSGSLVSSDIQESSSGMRELHTAPRLPSFALEKNFRL